MNAETRKQAILDATEALLMEVGGAGLTMRKVADRAAISLGNLQYHFPKRDDLLAALLRRFLRRYEDGLKTFPFEAAGDPGRDLSALFLAILRNPENHACGIVFREVWAASNQSAVLRDELTTFYRRLSGFYLRVLRQLTGDDIATEKLERIVRVLVPMMEGHCITGSASSLSDEQLARDWAQTLSAALT